MRTTAAMLLGVLLLLAPGLGQAAKVYKWTDDQGNVIYSDSPGPGAVEIEVPTEPAGIVPVRPQQTPPPSQPAPGSVYSALVMGSPTEDQIIEDPSGWVTVSLAIAPSLRVADGDAIRLKLDGQTLDARYTGSEMAVPGVPRGTHTLQAEVVNHAGNVLIASGTVTFHMHARSSQAPTGPEIYEPVYPPQPYPPVYPPVYPPQGRPTPTPLPTR